MFPISSVIISIYVLFQGIKQRRYSTLLYFWVFFIPFTATAWINFVYSGNTKSISIAHIISIFLIFIYLFQTKKISIENKKYFFILGLLNTLVLISLFVNMIWPIDFPIYSAVYAAKDQLIDTSITLRNFLNFSYFFMGTFMFLILIEKVKTQEVFLKLIQIYIISTGFMSFWGIMQAMTFYLGLEYPSFIFNTSTNINALGYTGTFEGIKRISSFAVEPSIMAQSILIGLALLMYFGQSGIKLFKPNVSKFLAVLMLSVLLISTSFLAYVGLAVLFFIYISRNNIVLVSLLAFSALIGVFFSPLIELKLNSYSVLERVNSIVQGLEYFLNSIFFGVGFASITSHDLLVNVLANTGLFSFIVFFVYLVTLFLEKKTEYYFVMKKVLILLLILQLLTGFTYVYFTLWFILGLTVLSSKFHKLEGVK